MAYARVMLLAGAAALAAAVPAPHAVDTKHIDSVLMSHKLESVFDPSSMMSKLSNRPNLSIEDRAHLLFALRIITAKQLGNEHSSENDTPLLQHALELWREQVDGSRPHLRTVLLVAKRAIKLEMDRLPRDERAGLLNEAGEIAEEYLEAPVPSPAPERKVGGFFGSAADDLEELLVASPNPKHKRGIHLEELLVASPNPKHKRGILG